MAEGAAVKIRNRVVDTTDSRSPMLRLLQDGESFGHVYVNYDQQWRTLWKAQRLGYVTDDCDQLLTDAGRAFIASALARALT